MITRLLIGLAGVAMAAYGVMKLASYSLSDLVSVAVALAAGVVVHDAVLAPLTIAVAALGIRWVPARFRVPATGALVVLGTVTLTAIPVLLSLSPRTAFNATLLDRNYVLGWWVFAAIVVVGALLVAWRNPREPGRPRVEEKDG